MERERVDVWVDYTVNFVVNYIDPNSLVPFVVNVFGVVHDKGHEVEMGDSLRQGSRGSRIGDLRHL